MSGSEISNNTNYHPLLITIDVIAHVKHKQCILNVMYRNVALTVEIVMVICSLQTIISREDRFMEIERYN